MHGNSLSSSSKPVTADWPFMTSFPFQRGSFLAWICLCGNVSRGVTDLRRAGLVWPALGSACPSIPYLRIPELYDPFLSPGSIYFALKQDSCLISSYFLHKSQAGWSCSLSDPHIHLHQLQHHQGASSALWTTATSVKCRACLHSIWLVWKSNYRWACWNTSYYRARFHFQCKLQGTGFFFFSFPPKLGFCPLLA